MPTKTARSYSLSLVLADFLILVGAFSIAYIIRTQFDARPLRADVFAEDYLLLALIIAPAWQIIFGFLGLYNASVYSKRLTEIGRLFIGSFIGILLVIGLAYVINQPVFPARLVAAYAFAGAFVLLVFGRELMRQLRTYLFRIGAGINRVMVIGESEAMRDLVANLADTGRSGYRVVALVCPRALVPTGFKGEHFTSLDKALKAMDSMRVTAIIQTNLYETPMKNQAILGAAQEQHIQYSFIPGEAEFYSGKNSIDIFLGYPVINVHQTPLVGWGELVKRIFDVIVTCLTLLVLSPLVLLLILLQAIFNPGPVFYLSNRLTRYSQSFKLIKFRSMDARYGRADAASEFRAMGREDLAKEYEEHRKVLHDPRITAFGRFLRATSLDELPQLFNVLKGDLSLVGPRPILPQELPLYRGRGALLHSVKSGITGLWQVSGRNNLRFEQRVELELYYAQNWTFWLDIKILLKTIPVVLLKRGAR